MKKSIIMITLLLLIAGMFSGCGHQHQHVWKEATCTEPKTCTECGETEGSPLGHTWTVATCTAPKTCSVCGKTDGSALEHTWIEATCSAPKTCSVCGKTDGAALEHTWMEGTCTTPKTCIVCGETEGELAEHDLDSTGKCTVCGEQVGFALNMSNYKNYLSINLRPRGLGGSINDNAVEYTIEPTANVTFCNVTVTISVGRPYEWKEETVQVDDTGYSSGILYDNNGHSKMTMISGYIIE